VVRLTCRRAINAWAAASHDLDPSETNLTDVLAGGDVGINQGGEPFARETLALLTRGLKSDGSVIGARRDEELPRTIARRFHGMVMRSCVASA
jgi:hypothetical protein